MKTTKASLLALALQMCLALAFVSCKEDEDEVAIAPRVTTIEATDITFNSAKLGGSITSNGGSGIIAKGICYATAPSPTIENDTTNQGENSEAFVAQLSELLPNTTYYARAYAINGVGTSYGEEFSFITQDGLAKVSLEISEVTFKKALNKLTVTSVGGSPLINTGFVYSAENQIPTISDNMYPNFAVELTAEHRFTDLSVATTYYVRAYARNSQGTAYSDVVSFTTKSLPTITDIDGNVYQTILIGDQAWMNQNLRVTKYNNGDAIATTLVDVSAEASPKYQWAYNNDDSNAFLYGRHYTHYALNDERKVCPAGTHVPSAEEMNTMLGLIGNDGGKYKIEDTQVWKAPNTGATNSSGFNATGSGYRSLYGIFFNFQENVFFTTSTDDENNNSNIKGFYLSYNNQSVVKTPLPKKSGFSVRCVAD